MEKKSYNKQIFYILLFFAIIALFVVCKVLQSFLLPIFTAFFLSFIFLPIISKVHEKTKIPWLILCIFIVLILFFAVISISSILIKSISSISSEYSVYEKNFLSLIDKVTSFFHIQYNEEKTIFENLYGLINIGDFLQTGAITLSSTLVNFVKTFFLCVFMLIFLLIECKQFKEKINLAFTNQTKINNVSNKIITEVVRYLSIKFFISLATGLIIYLGCLIVGLKFAILWGFLAFILNFIPTFGSLFSCIITILFSIMQFYPSWTRIIIISTIMISTNVILGNILEPRIEGKHLGISPFIILIGLTFFGFLWGFTGLIFAVPMLVIIKIVCENIPYLHPVAIFISNNPKETKSELKK